MPVPASLDILRDSIDEDTLQNMIDKICRLHSASPPMLLRCLRVASSGSGGESSAGAADAKTVLKKKRTLTAAELTANPTADQSGRVALAIRGELRFALESGLATAIMCVVIRAYVVISAAVAYTPFHVQVLRRKTHVR